MVRPCLGTLSTAQALTAGTTVGEFVIQGPALDYAAITDVWLTIDTVVAASGSGTLQFDLVLGDAEGLDSTNVVAVRIYCAAVTDKRVATAGRHITAINVGKVLKQMLDTDGSSYPYVGLVSTLGGTAAITINASLSATEPQSEMHRMTTESNVTVPAVASAGSGF